MPIKIPYPKDIGRMELKILAQQYCQQETHINYVIGTLKIKG